MLIEIISGNVMVMVVVTILMIVMILVILMILVIVVVMLVMIVFLVMIIIIRTIFVVMMVIVIVIIPVIMTMVIQAITLCFYFSSHYLFFSIRFSESQRPERLGRLVRRSLGQSGEEQSLK